MADPKITIELVEAGTAVRADGVGPPMPPRTTHSQQQREQTAFAGGVGRKASDDSSRATRGRAESSALQAADGAASTVARSARKEKLSSAIILEDKIEDALLLDPKSQIERASSKASEIGGLASRVGAKGIGSALSKGGVIGQAATKIGPAIAAAGPLAPIVAAVAGSAALIGAAVKVGLNIAEGRAGELAFASPAIATAQAITEARDIASEIRQAGAIGGTLAGITETRGDIARDIKEITTVLIAPFMEILQDLLTVVESFTRPLSAFFEEHRELISRLVKAWVNWISPMTKVIEWLARLAGEGNRQEFGDPIAEMIARLKGEPIDPAWAQGARNPGGGGGGVVVGGAVEVAAGFVPGGTAVLGALRTLQLAVGLGGMQ